MTPEDSGEQMTAEDSAVVCDSTRDERMISGDSAVVCDSTGEERRERMISEDSAVKRDSRVELIAPEDSRSGLT